jgi:predicted Zn-dependent peptidase
MKAQDIRPIVDYNLNNGIRVVFIPMDGANTTTVSVVVNNGHHHDPKGSEGIAHFVEHAVYKGTERFTIDKFNKEVALRGITSNAYTSDKYVNHYMTGVNCEMSWMIEALSEIVLHPTFPEAEIEKERNVVLDEITYRKDNHGIRVYDNAMTIVGSGTAYARPGIGYAKTVAKITAADLAKFHRSRYNPKNLTIVVAGGFFISQCAKEISYYFETKAPKSSERAFKYSEHVITSPRSDLVEVVPGINSSWVQYVWKIGGLDEYAKYCDKPTDKSDYRLSCLTSLYEQIVLQGASSKLYDIREKAGICYSIGGWIDLHRDTGFLYAGGSSRHENLEKLTKMMQSAILTASDKAFTKTAIENAARGVSNDLIKRGDSSASVARYYAHDVGEGAALAPFRDAIECCKYSFSKSDFEFITDSLHVKPVVCVLTNE